MDEEKKSVDKEKLAFSPKGYWIEKNEKGEKMYCHKGRNGGKPFTIKQPLKEIVRLLAA